MLATVAEQLRLYKPPAATDEHDDDGVVSKVGILESATPVVVMFLYTGYLECYSTSKQKIATYQEKILTPIIWLHIGLDVHQRIHTQTGLSNPIDLLNAFSAYLLGN
ncbi:hypothetical protein Tco_0150406 [Tanacetum coccineum]